MKAFIIIIGLGIGVALNVFGQADAKPQGAVQGAASASAPAPLKASGSVVFVDPATRKIRKPSASEIGDQRAQAEAVRLARPATPPVLIHGPGGAAGILLDDSDMSYMVATRKSDGKIALDCVTGPDTADHAAKSSQPAKTATEMK